MTDVNLGDVVWVLDPLFSPTVDQLRLSVNFVVLPSVQYTGVLAAFQCSSSCIHAFLMILLPWFMTTFLSSRNDGSV